MECQHILCSKLFKNGCAAINPKTHERKRYRSYWGEIELLILLLLAGDIELNPQFLAQSITSPAPSLNSFQRSGFGSDSI